MRVLKGSWTSLNFALQIKVKLLCSCLRLFDVIVKLHAMDENMFKDFLIKRVKVDFVCNRMYSNCDLYFVYLREAVITLH